MSWTEPTPNVFLDHERRLGIAVKELPSGEYDWGALVPDFAGFPDGAADVASLDDCIRYRWMRMIGTGLAPTRDEAIRLAKWSVEP